MWNVKKNKMARSQTNPRAQNECKRNDERKNDETASAVDHQEMIKMFMLQMQQMNQIGGNTTVTLQTGMKTMARGMATANYMKEIKMCGYESTGLQRIAFLSKCEDRRSGDEYDDAWTCVMTRSSDVPPECKMIAESCIREQGKMTYEAYRSMASKFIFRKRTTSADDIAEEAVTLMENYGSVKGSKINEYYGVARKAWSSVLYAYDLEEKDAVPARATKESFLKEWSENLMPNVKKYVRLQRVQARNQQREFTIEDANNAAQDYMNCSTDEEPLAVTRDSLRKSNMLAIVRKPNRPNMRNSSNTKCIFFERGQCRRGENCNFSHDKRKREHNDDNQENNERNKRNRYNESTSAVNTSCRRCGSSEHRYSTKCPSYAGCRRCDNKDHMFKNCTEECRKCGADANKECEENCQARAPHQYFRQ